MLLSSHCFLFFAVDDQRPYLKLQCSSKYRANGTFQVTLEWSVAPSVRGLQAIQEFQLLRQVPHNTSKETVSRKVNETLSIYTHKGVPQFTIFASWLNAQDNKFNYTFIETIEANQVTPNHTYTFLVRYLNNAFMRFTCSPSRGLGIQFVY